jgi:hypothetical protein
MAYDITTGGINGGVLYIVTGTVTYNGTAYTNQTFRGVLGVSAFTGTGSVTEVTEFAGASVIFQANPNESKGTFPEVTNIIGTGVIFQQNASEAHVIETTQIQGMAVQLVDYPFYQFDIMEQRG